MIEQPTAPESSGSQPESFQKTLDQLQTSVDQLKQDNPELAALFEEILTDLEELHQEAATDQLKERFEDREELPEPIQEKLTTLESKIAALDEQTYEQLPPRHQQLEIDQQVAEQAAAEKQARADHLHHSVVRDQRRHNNRLPDDAFSQRVLKPTIGKALQQISHRLDDVEQL